MTRETSVSLSPEEIVDLAKAFFTSLESGYSASLVDEGDGFVRLQTFRGHLAITAWREGERTRVRLSTLRYHPSIGEFLLRIETQSSAQTA